MQPRVGRRVAAERLPRRQEIQPRAEAELDDREPRPRREALRQAVAAEKYVTGFVQPAIERKVNVLELLREQRAVAKGNLRGDDRNETQSGLFIGRRNPRMASDYRTNHGCFLRAMRAHGMIRA
jgi:hypothetical protein